MKCQADDFDDPTMLVSGESEKELARARKVMGSEWVVKLKRKYVYLFSNNDRRVYFCALKGINSGAGNRGRLYEW